MWDWVTVDLNNILKYVSTFQGNKHSNSALSLPTEVQLSAYSVPQSPRTNDIHSTSSNQGSNSLSSSELALHEISFKSNRKHRPKVSSADSILSMFRNFSSPGMGNSYTASFVISPTSTPSSPVDIGYEDESSTSSLPTPVSFSSGAPDSPLMYRQSSIEVPVLEAINSHRTISSQNLLHPPSIMLELPGNINKCLSPIHELPSPALSPIFLKRQSRIQDETISVMINDDEDKNVINKRRH